MEELTFEAIDELEAGLEINALVAKHVMGHKACRRNTIWIDNPEDEENGGWEELVALYSGNVEASWRVVERMRELGYFIEIEDQGDVYYVLFWGRSHGRAVSASISLATCKAALKAVVQLGESALSCCGCGHG
jgi:hypothetical protein